MKKLISSITLALVITAFASTAFADGGDFVLRRIEKQKEAKTSVVSVQYSKEKTADSKTVAPDWKMLRH